MKRMRRRKAILGAAICILLGICIFLLVHREPVRNCWHKNPDLFLMVANDLCSNMQRNDSVILIDRGFDIQDAAGYPMSSEVMSAIEFIFSASDCDNIFASRTRQGTLYCRFSTDHSKFVNGVAFVDDERHCEPFDSIFSGLLVRERLPIDNGWLYFEYLTLEGEKEAGS